MRGELVARLCENRDVLKCDVSFSVGIYITLEILDYSEFYCQGLASLHLRPLWLPSKGGWWPHKNFSSNGL